MIASPPDAARTRPACAWCEQPLAHFALRVPGQLRCERCGARTLLTPTHAAPHTIVAAAARPARRPHRLCTLGEAARRSARRHMANRIARVAPPGPVLDVGSGDGMLLDALRATGRLATGIGGLVGVQSRAGIREADITELGGRYAAIVFWQSLGRLRAPAAALDHAAALLKPGGLLAIAQPSPTRLHARALGERLLTSSPPREHVQIPPWTLVERLRELGLQVDEVDSRRGLDLRTPGGWLSGLLGGVVAIEARR